MDGDGSDDDTGEWILMADEDNDVREQMVVVMLRVNRY